jgi:hypothetical protein
MTKLQYNVTIPRQSLVVARGESNGVHGSCPTRRTMPLPSAANAAALLCSLVAFGRLCTLVSPDIRRGRGLCRGSTNRTKIEPATRENSDPKTLEHTSLALSYHLPPSLSYCKNSIKHSNTKYRVTWAVEIERGESRGAVAAVVLQYPRCYDPRGYYSRVRAARARESRPQGVRSRPGKEEGFSFLILA